jgi:TPR repeat protein
MPKSMRPVVKLEDGEGGLQEEAGAGGGVGVQRRRVGEAGDAARDEDQVRLLWLNMEAQAQAIRGMEQTRVLGEELLQVKACEAELRVNVEALQSIIQAKDDQLQTKDLLLRAKDREISLLVQSKDDQLQAKDREISLLLQAKDTELRVLQAENARLSAGSAAGGAARQPAPAPPAAADAAAQAETVFQEGQRLYGEQRFSEAAERWGRAALLRHAPSHAHLSVMLVHGRPGVAVDKKRGFELAAVGAALGCAHSKGALGLCYVLGDGVAKDAARGLALGRESAAAGSCFGQHVVGRCYRNGRGGVVKDYAEAVRLYSLAAAQGDARAQNNLGVMFYIGRGVAQDYAEAARLYRLSAAQGHASAQFNLGVMFSKGQGVAQDYAEAARLYRLSAAQGHAGAQNNLGSMLEKGRGVAQDRAEAIRWYRLAAAQGNAYATAALQQLGA